jgi:hypothetical protein
MIDCGVDLGVTTCSDVGWQHFDLDVRPDPYVLEDELARRTERGEIGNPQ